jgi:hypothetical protein
LAIGAFHVRTIVCALDTLAIQPGRVDYRNDACCGGTGIGGLLDQKLSPSNKVFPMRYRKLRIAWSVVWGVACVLLIALWVRSYWWADELRNPAGTVAMSVQGKVHFSGAAEFYPHEQLGNGTYYLGMNLWLYHILIERRPSAAAYRHGYIVNSPTTKIVLPYLLIVGTTIFLAAAPWIRLSSRFSLRTLLIATTLVAVVLGLIVWAAR